MSKISVLVVDDEKPARRRVVELLERSGDVGSIAECANGADAVRAVSEHPPDLLFLDVQMPEVDGFGVLDRLGPARAPLTVFVTAYDRFAIQAFERNALDYLLKPFSDERFERCLARALEHLRTREQSRLNGQLQQLLDLWKNQQKPSTYIERLAVKDRGRIVFVSLDEVAWIEAAGVYVDIHAGRETYLHRALLGELERQLDPARFVRIHRSAMVNVERIRELRMQSHGDGAVILKDGTELRLSRNYRARIEQCLGQAL